MEQKVSRSRFSAALGADGFLQRMWERLTTKRSLAKHLLEEATKAVQLESTSSCQNESPYEKELERLGVSSDLGTDDTFCIKRLRR